MKKATEYYVESLKSNPFMWDAFLDLCDAGKFGEHKQLRLDGTDLA